MIFVFSIYNNDANSARSVWKKYLTFQNCEIYFNSSVERILYHHITINTSHCDACDNGMKFFILSPQSPQSLQFKQSPQSLQVRLAHLRVDFQAFFLLIILFLLISYSEKKKIQNQTTLQSTAWTLNGRQAP